MAKALQPAVSASLHLRLSVRSSKCLIRWIVHWRLPRFLLDLGDEFNIFLTTFLSDTIRVRDRSLHEARKIIILHQLPNYQVDVASVSMARARVIMTYENMPAYHVFQLISVSSRSTASNLTTTLHSYSTPPYRIALPRTSRVENSVRRIVIGTASAHLWSLCQAIVPSAVGFCRDW